MEKFNARNPMYNTKPDDGVRNKTSNTCIDLLRFKCHTYSEKKKSGKTASQGHYWRVDYEKWRRISDGKVLLLLIGMKASEAGTTVFSKAMKSAPTFQAT